jgi:hypothetical protein
MVQSEQQQAHRAAVWARAYHEAAHAVTATLLGGRVASVEVWAGPPTGGRTEVTGLEDELAGPKAFGLVRQIVCLLAGPVAEIVGSGGSGMILNEPAAFVSETLSAQIADPASADAPPDIQTVAGLILDHFGPDDEPGIAAAVDHLALNVETFVRGEWSAIELVAFGLLRQGRFTEDDLRSLLARALPSAPPAELLQLLP